MIEIANKMVSDVDFRVMDVRNIGKLKGSFDAVVCSFCIPFLSKSDTVRLIEDSSGILVKGGLLYLSTMEGEESKSGFEGTSFSGDSEVYFNYYTQTEVKKALRKSGFEIEYSFKQDYKEPDGTISIDLIFIARKK